MSDAVPMACDGHGAIERRGRFASGAEDPVAAAMRRLLELGDAKASSRGSTVDGRRVHFLDAGDGPAVILLHGASGGGANWYRIIGALAQHFRVLAPDLPGLGLSDAVPLTAPLSSCVTSVLEAWLEQLGVEPHAVCGTSFGGLLALRLAQRREHLRALAPIDSAGAGNGVSPYVQLAALPLVGPALLRPSRAGTAWMLRRIMTNGARGIPAEEQDALVEYLWRCEQRGGPRLLADAIRLFAQGRRQREVLSDEELGAIRIPTFIVWGEQDRFFPVSHGRRLAAAIPDARMEILPRIGHSPNWEAPDSLVPRLTSFLLATLPR